MNGFAQEISLITTKDTETVINKYCDSQKLGKLYVSWAKCGTAAHNESVQCWKNYVLYLDQLSSQRDRIPDVDKAPLICWFVLKLLNTYLTVCPLFDSNAHRFDNCFEESMIKMGEDVCPQSSVSGLRSIWTEVGGKGLDMFCGDYNSDNDLCDTIDNKYKYLYDIQLKKEPNKSPLIPFIEIVGTPGYNHKSN